MKTFVVAQADRYLAIVANLLAGSARFVVAMLALLACAPAFSAACIDGGRCEVQGGYYLAKPPSHWDGQSALPVVVYFHGWNGSPEGTFRNRAMISAVHKRGALFVAPFAQTGYWRQIGEGRAEGGRDELAYVQAVIADLKHRWPIDQGRLMASGFSRGASMVWNLACYAGPIFTAYAPIAGGFWGSNPQTCATGAVNLRHIHGRKDRVVAFDEVGIYNSMPIPEGIALLRRLNGCAQRPDQKLTIGRYQCDVWSSCEADAELQLCLHPRGHSIRAEWVAEGLDWMLALPD